MTWFKVDDKLHGHPKWTRTTAEAKALWTTAGSWCGSYNTDGVITPHDLDILAPATGLSRVKARRAAENLVEHDLWRPGKDGGWVFHNWVEFNPTRKQTQLSDDIEKERRAIQKDDVLKAAVRLRDADRCCFCDEVVNFAARTGQLAGQYDHTVPLKKGGKTSLANVRVICRYHNQKKAGRQVSELPDWFPDLLEPWTHRHPVSARPGSDSVPDSVLSRVGTGRDGSGPGRDRDGTGAGLRLVEDATDRLAEAGLLNHGQGDNDG